MGGLYEELIEAKSAGNRTLKVVCFLELALLVLLWQHPCKTGQ